ncbi:MAG: sensor histidine kinase [Coriobacteriales bacterium]
MIVIPVVVAVIVAAAVGVAMWYSISHGTGLWTDDSEDFFKASDAVIGTLSSSIESDGVDSLDASTVAKALDSANMSLVVTSGGTQVFSHGQISETDKQLIDSANQIGGNVKISRDSRCVNLRSVSSGASQYEVYVLGTTSEVSGEITKQMVVIGVLVVLAAIVIVVLLTNRFLSRFVLRNITEPLSSLSNGTRQIRDGNLRYRLPEGRDDEFAPVFDDFNDMASRLADSVERDRRMEEQRRNLMIGISHDLRSPLTSIQAYAEGIRDGIADTPKAQEKYVDRIVDKTQEMRSLLERMSEIARLDRDVADTKLLECNLDDCALEWLDENESAYRLLGVEVERELDWAPALVDTELVSRILSNLMDNCAKYARTDNETCHVKVSSGTEGAFSYLRVEDDGPGVEPGTEERLFDLFYRGDDARTSTQEGNGIGLGIVKIAMDRMNGKAVAEPSSLGGLSISLLFPTMKAAGDDEGGEEVSRE